MSKTYSWILCYWKYSLIHVNYSILSNFMFHGIAVKCHEIKQQTIKKPQTSNWFKIYILTSKKFKVILECMAQFYLESHSSDLVCTAYTCLYTIFGSKSTSIFVEYSAIYRYRDIINYIIPNITFSHNPVTHCERSVVQQSKPKGSRSLKLCMGTGYRFCVGIISFLVSSSSMVNKWNIQSPND